MESYHALWSDDKHHSATITISRISSETDINLQVRMGEAVETWLGLVMLDENKAGRGEVGSVWYGGGGGS
jgi:hypothetical protein